VKGVAGISYTICEGPRSIWLDEICIKFARAEACAGDGYVCIKFSHNLRAGIRRERSVRILGVGVAEIENFGKRRRAKRRATPSINNQTKIKQTTNKQRARCRFNY